MGRVSASIQVPGRASDAEALWYDPMRWAAWVDGFAHASKVPPTSGPRRARCSGTAARAAAGACSRRSSAYEARIGQTLRVEDERLRGTQRVEFRPAPRST